MRAKEAGDAQNGHSLEPMMAGNVERKAEALLENGYKDAHPEQDQETANGQTTDRFNIGE